MSGMCLTWFPPVWHLARLSHGLSWWKKPKTNTFWVQEPVTRDSACTTHSNIPSNTAQLLSVYRERDTMSYHVSDKTWKIVCLVLNFASPSPGIYKVILSYSNSRSKLCFSKVKYQEKKWQRHRSPGRKEMFECQHFRTLSKWREAINRGQVTLHPTQVPFLTSSHLAGEDKHWLGRSRGQLRHKRAAMTQRIGKQSAVQRQRNMKPAECQYLHSASRSTYLHL